MKGNSMAEKKQRYIAPFASKTFFVEKKDKDGNAIGKTDPRTGATLYVGDKPEYLTEKYSFTQAPRQKGQAPFCVFDVKEDTPQDVIVHLEKLAKDPNAKIFKEEEFACLNNPNLKVEIERRRQAEVDAKNAKSEAKKAKERSRNIISAINTLKPTDSIELLKKKLQELGD